MRKFPGLLALLCCLFLLIQIEAKAEILSMNDVSILLPLPPDLKSDLLPKPLDKGAFGELLPQELYAELPTIAEEEPEVTWDRLRIVAIRLDPCFPSEQTPVQCLTQVRVVWQPLELVHGEGVFAQDAAIHVFYSIPKDDFADLMTDMIKLKKSSKLSTEGLPLNVHPILQKEGLGGKYGKKLLARILKSVGKERLTQVTFTQLTGGGNIWIFGGIKVENGIYKDIRIPRTTKIRQGFFNNLNNSHSFAAGGISPHPEGADIIDLLVSDSSQLTKEDEPQIQEAAIAATKIENPSFHNPNTMDCASCHVAQPARIFATVTFPHLKLEDKMEKFRFKSEFDLTNISPNQFNTNRVRAFGYEGNGPAISQRTINETAAVLEALAAANSN